MECIFQTQGMMSQDLFQFYLCTPVCPDLDETALLIFEELVCYNKEAPIFK